MDKFVIVLNWVEYCVILSTTRLSSKKKKTGTLFIDNETGIQLNSDLVTVTNVTQKKLHTFGQPFYYVTRFNPPLK